MRFLSSQPTRVGSAVALGKIPQHPEFLTNRSGREPEQSFDTWLEAGMGLANHRYGAAWTRAFELGAALGFVWRAPRASGRDTLLCGVMFPSCDSVGRHYPLAVACDVPRALVARAPHVVPLAFGDFFDSAQEAVADASAYGPAELAARLLVLGGPSDDDVARAAADYEDWCQSTHAESAWSAIFEDYPVERCRAVIEDIRVATASICGVEAPTRALTLRLPLGVGGPASAAIWLDVVRRLCRWNTTVPSTFWGIADGSLVIALGDAEPDVLSALWYRESAGENVFEPGARFDALPPSSSPFSQRITLSPESAWPSTGDAPIRFDGPMTALLASLTR